MVVLIIWLLCPRRQKAIEKGVARTLALTLQGHLAPKLVAAGQAYMMSKKESTAFSIVVVITHFLNSKPFCFLLDLGATHLFMST